MVVTALEQMEMLLNNNSKGNYHLGKMFFDVLKTKSPDDIFQIDAATGEQETNGSVLDRAVHLSKAFRHFGLKPGDVLALGGRNHLDLHIPYYAAMMEGLPVVGVDPYFKYDEIKNLFKLAEPKIAFCQQETKALYERAAQELGITTKVVAFDGDYALSQFVGEYGDKEDDGNYVPAEFDTDKIYSWLLSTSGTTGLPKIAAFKHQVVIATTLQFSKMNPPRKKSANRQMYLNLSPPQWLTAYYIALSSPLLDMIKLQTSTPEDLGHIIDIINKYRPAMTMLSPSMLTMLLKQGPACDLTCFNSITLTGAKVYKDLLVDVKARIRPDCVLMEAYAQTETLGPCLMPVPNGPLGNCGVHIPGHGREVKLVDPKTGDEITEANVTGELWTRGPSFSEYYKCPEETAKAFAEDGWYKTGDLLYRDDTNHFYFVDRIKMLIKYRNYHINPHELEEVISRLEGVLEVCVVGIPHPEDSQRPVACVVRAPGAALSADEVKKVVAENLSDTKQLRGGVIFMDSLPKTSSGKVARAKVAAIASTANRE